jgi:hypothetical protein
MNLIGQRLTWFMLRKFYRVEEASELIRIFQTIDGEEERYSARRDFDQTMKTLRTTLEAIGTIEVRQKRVKRRKVRTSTS